MDTFSEVRAHVMEHHELEIDEPFLLSFECVMDDNGRRQGMFVAELNESDGRRFLRSARGAWSLSGLWVLPAVADFLLMALVLRMSWIEVPPRKKNT